MSRIIRDEIISALSLCPMVRTKKGDRHPEKARWIADVIGLGISIDDLLAAQEAGLITLHRCDLPYMFEGESKHREGAVLNGGLSVYHFVTKR